MRKFKVGDIVIVDEIGERIKFKGSPVELLGTIRSYWRSQDGRWCYDVDCSKEIKTVPQDMLKRPLNYVDRLKTMYDKQQEFHNQVKRQLPKSRVKANQKLILAIMAECTELLDSMPWKWWKKKQKLDEENIRVEIIDLLHFVLTLAIVNGMTAEDIYKEYMEKNKENFRRQENGY